ncbi:Receptor-like serine/threonine-protein kinase [Heracleum sosnowskyi]|uniref:Receptor-like serine/threonine-protein kinase n=1 Tax=Heracleum sosnowskyi TaxID=360622 RepID=A0AAD8HPH1_9APIA|nr:Receptor-like serine/threonine-protein kinase [Heracleum sosnowskyi]
MKHATMIILYFSTLLLFSAAAAVDVIRANETIRDGDTIVSARGEFELGFFSPGNSTKRYLGIWYKKIAYGTVVWVANRDTPLTTFSGTARFNNKGIVVLSNDKIIWSSNTRYMENPIAQLLDTGNLVFREENDDNFVWQSFDYPGNVMLPGMAMGSNLVTGHERNYTSWRSVDDPSPGRFLYRVDSSGFPQALLWKDSLLWTRTGPWIGSHSSGNPTYSPNGISKIHFTFNKKEIYYGIDLINQSSSATTFFMLHPNGDSQFFVWNHQKKDWMVYLTLHGNDCDRYALCGPYSICNKDRSPRCECMTGFTPKFPDKWRSLDWSGGCVRKKVLDCRTKVGFQKYSGVKLPDTRQSWYDMRINLNECQRLCLKNCSCAAYAIADNRRGGRGCFLWFSPLIDITGYNNDGQDIYVRMLACELGKGWRPRELIATFWVLTVPVALIFRHMYNKRKLNREERLKFSSKGVPLNRIDSEDLDLPLFKFLEVAKATNNFSDDNKLGEGGFGPVYKGMLDDGQMIAAKRLSENSSQGLNEFKNEVSCIGKLQHRNLVTLLGCCIEKGERILIYEYMPNKSLDFFIFDEQTSKSFEWLQRYNIINGIARGLLYLHQDSRLRVIHRDLKASNILLDYEMNPKISDFGLARSFIGSQTEENTKRVVGTYGYMSPEYAIDGIFSIKSDVYSFGVLLIEIVTGKKNRSFSRPDHSLNLIGHVWMSYKEENLLELIDEGILESSNRIEVFRIIQIGLLCVQECPQDRPSMSEVVLMLSSTINLPHPKQPGFFTGRKQHRANYSRRNSIMTLSNQQTLTTVSPRD